MSFLALAGARYSVRSYTDAPVEDDKLQQVLEAARIAPSACNLQPWRIVVVTQPEGRAALGQAYDREWFRNAPVQIAVCVDTEECWKRFDGVSYAEVDAAIAMDHITLAACDQGLGTCWIGAFKADVARTALGLPAHVSPVALTPLGYPAARPKPKDRKPADDIVYWERFGGKRG